MQASQTVFTTNLFSSKLCNDIITASEDYIKAEKTSITACGEHYAKVMLLTKTDGRLQDIPMHRLLTFNLRC